MNILIIAPALPPDALGGGEIFDYNIIQFLKERHNVSVLTRSPHEIVGVNKYRIKRVISTKVSYLFWLFRALYKERKRNDVVFVSHTDVKHWLYWILFPVFKMFSRINYLVILYSGQIIEWGFPFPHRFFFKNASNILALDKMVQDHYTKITGSNVSLIQQSCDSFINVISTSKVDLRKKYNIDQDTKIILFFSRFHPIKSPVTILESIDYLGEEYLRKNRMVFWFCGAGEDLDSFQEDVVLRPHLHSFIKIWGRVSDDDKSAIYKMSDIFIQPSLSEGSPPVTLEEAMKNGIACISTNITEIADHYRNNENILLFKKQNYEDLSHKIKYLIENPDISSSIGISAKMHYDIHASKTNMLAEIEDYLVKSGDQ